MPSLRVLLSAAFAVALPALHPGCAIAQTKITVGMVVGGTGGHLPSYVAMDRGFFKGEGLDARWVTLGGKGLVTAGLTGAADFVPATAGGAVAALHGAPVRYVVGQSLGSQWVIVTPKTIKSAMDLRGKTLGYGRAGGADYDEGADVLRKVFHMSPGKDYKVISFQAEPERIAALINGDIQGALVTFPIAVKAEKAGFKILLRTSDYIPRLAGPIWTIEPYLAQHREAVKKFIEAIARAIMYIRNNKSGTVPVIEKYLGIKDPEEASLLWDDLHDSFGATLPAPLFRKIFESRRDAMVVDGEWPKNKPVPDPEQFAARKLLDESLAEVHYVAMTAKTTK